MFRPRSVLPLLVAMSTTLLAEDFGPVVKVANLVFPERTHFGVICNLGHSRDAVNDLLRALPEGSTLTVVDAHHPSQIDAAGSVIAHRGVRLLALLPSDPLVRDGSPFATNIVQRFNGTIPAFGTTAAALQNGCAFALGKGTDWKLLVNPGDPSVKGVIENITIEEITGPDLPSTSGSSSASLHVVTLSHR